ncbi:MAG: HAMP domain-containing histidine kinase, partial [Acidimicrobiaceae bacterium]|nr:HAMP domain-containing histidine kinase [Acidimicrobiaceae bacterium]
MPRRAVRTGRLRRRLFVAFVAVAAVSAGALAISSYYLVRQSRLQDSLDRAHVEARVDLGLAGGIHFASGTPDPTQFVQGYELRNVHAVLRFPGGTVASDPDVDPPIPPRLERLVAAGQLGYTRIDVRGSPYLVLGGRAADSDGQLYYLFSEAGIYHDLGRLARVLLAGWAAVVVLSGFVGRLLARRTLEPVARASEAARSIAEGLLATRLPVGREDEFGRWAASFNDMADALETKIAALAEAEARERRFTSDVAHELRTPLTALVAEASLLRDHLARMPAEIRRPAELLIGDIGRLRTLVEELMEISRLDARSEPVRVEPVDLR